MHIKLAIVGAVVLAGSLGAIGGAALTQSALADTLLPQSVLVPQPWPVIDIAEQVPMSLTVQVTDNNGETIDLGVPAILNYEFRATVSTDFAYKPMEVPPRATFGKIIDLQTADSVKYDSTGLPYYLEKDNNVEVAWGPTANYEDDFVLEGTIKNVDEVRYLKDANATLSVFDSDGNFLGTGSNTSRLVSDGFDDPLKPGDGADFYILASDVDFFDVAFYILQIHTVHSDPPKGRQ